MRFLVVTLLFLSGCDLFDQIKCAKAADCPANEPFCTDGVCSKVDGTGREGEGEGAGACTADTDCQNGLCFDGTTGIATKNTCLPPAGDATADCSSDPNVQGQKRTDAAAPVIFDVQSTAFFGDGPCWSNVSFKWFQRTPQPVTNGGIELVYGGGDLTIGPPSSADDTSVTIDTLCFPGSGPTAGQEVGIVFDNGGVSNVGCLAPAAGTP
jgi:hypothetical protein